MSFGTIVQQLCPLCFSYHFLVFHLLLYIVTGLVAPNIYGVQLRSRLGQNSKGRTEHSFPHALRASSRFNTGLYSFLIVHKNLSKKPLLIFHPAKRHILHAFEKSVWILGFQLSSRGAKPR